MRAWQIHNARHLKRLRLNHKTVVYIKTDTVGVRWKLFRDIIYLKVRASWFQINLQSRNS